jgi:hypothetical protein
MERAYRQSTILLSGAIAVLGLAIVVSTLIDGGGPLQTRVVLGVLLALLGLGRVYLAGGFGSRGARR